MAYILLRSANLTPTTYHFVIADSLSIAGKREVRTAPNANWDNTIVEGQTLNMENLIYNLNNVKFNYATSLSSSTLTIAGSTLPIFSYADLLTLYRASFIKTNPIFIKMVYGNNTLIGYDGTTTEISLILKTFNTNISASESDKGYMPTTNITFVETEYT